MVTSVYSTVGSGVDQRKYQSSASLAFVRGIHLWPVNSPHKGPVTRKMCPFDDVIHYDDVIIGAIASQITSLTIVYSTVYSGADQNKHQSPASLAFVWGIHRGPVNSPHKGPVTRNMFPFDDVIMCVSNLQQNKCCRFSDLPISHLHNGEVYNLCYVSLGTPVIIPLSPLIARFIGPIWSPSGADRTQVCPMLTHEPCYLGPDDCCW